MLKVLCAALTATGSANALPFVEQDVLGSESLRLISTAPGTSEWLSFEDILNLKRENVNFMDITDHQDLEILSSKEKKPTEFPTDVAEKKYVKSAAKDLSKEELESKLKRFTSFFTRYAKSESGLSSSLWLHDQVVDLVNGRKDISVELFDHEWQQKSLIVRITGSENPDHVVVVGAHQDSINLLMPSILPSPGADDDGSGTVTTLEVLRVLLLNDFKPRNTVEFHWYSAEELGLLGSQDVFEEYSKKGIDVRAMLQQDMTGYSALSKENNGHDELGVITDYVDTGLTEFIKLLITEYCAIPYVETKCGYACSDHGSASKYGYQSAFVIEGAFENIDNKIHTTEDKVEFLDFDHMIEHAKLTLGYAVELGNAKL